MSSDSDSRYMLRALELARRGEGFVEPNPMVGCVIVRDGNIVGEGWHQRFGGEHAEIEALVAAGRAAAGAAMYVTLEPCCHYGKTPPCTEAIVPAGIKRVVCAMRDPFPKVAGGGFKQLEAAGIAASVGLHEAEARELNAPYLKLIQTGKPWVIAKWAMTLDGKIATRSGYSKWISSDESRAIAHELRGRVDAILVGRRTAQIDDPLLTCRLSSSPLPLGEGGEQSEPGEGLRNPTTLTPALSQREREQSAAPPRRATRIVLDSLAQLSSSSQLVRTARQTPTIIACGPDAAEQDIRRLTAAGCEVLPFAAATSYERMLLLLDELGRRQMTNILVEGGPTLLGALFDARQIDEVHAFLAPKLFGGQRAPSPIAGQGLDQPAAALQLRNITIQQVGPDLYLHGRTG
jgi:diaminohydroxyphosphoribosylaminopyrimidine deaminase/5-amino-6-(5-phosphoribosylamino)uracil reductase